MANSIVETSSGSFVHKNPVLLIFDDGNAAKLDLRNKNKFSDMIENYVKSKNQKTLGQLDEIARKKLTAETKGQKKNYVGLLKMYPDAAPVAVFELEKLNETAVKSWIGDKKWLKKEKISIKKKPCLKDIQKLNVDMGKDVVGSNNIRDVVRGKTTTSEVKRTRMYKNMKTPIFMMFSDGECFKCHLNTKNVPNEFTNMLMMADYYAHENPDFDKEHEMLKLLNDAANKKKDTKYDVKTKIIKKKDRKNFKMQAGGYSVGLIRHEDDPNGANKGICERWLNGKLELSHVMCLVDYDHKQSADSLKAILIEQRLQRAQKQNKELCAVLDKKEQEIVVLNEEIESISVVKTTITEYDSEEERMLNDRLIEAQRRESELRKQVEELERREKYSKMSKSKSQRVFASQTPKLSAVNSRIQTNMDQWNPIPISSSSEMFSDDSSRRSKSENFSSSNRRRRSFLSRKSSLSSPTAAHYYEEKNAVMEKSSYSKTNRGILKHTSNKPASNVADTWNPMSLSSDGNSSPVHYASPKRKAVGIETPTSSQFYSPRGNETNDTRQRYSLPNDGYSLRKTRRNFQESYTSQRLVKEETQTPAGTLAGQTLTRDDLQAAEFNSRRPYSSRHPEFKPKSRKYAKRGSAF